MIEIKHKYNNPLHHFIIFLKQKWCKHVFRGVDLNSRDSNGIVYWHCSKCGKKYEFQYGLQALEYGKISGPWGSKKI